MPGAGGAGAAEWMAPMLATATKTPADLPGRPEEWQVEPKLDGLRCIAVREGARVELWSRNRLSWTGRFPTVVAALGNLPAQSFVLDGELVSYDAAGRSSFGLLQSGRSGAPVLVAFDLLAVLGRDVRGLGLEDRRRLLAMVLGATGGDVAGADPLEGGGQGGGRAQTIPGNPPEAVPGMDRARKSTVFHSTSPARAGTWDGFDPPAPGTPAADVTAPDALRLVEVLDGAPASLLERACAAGWEGIVAKRRASIYTSGRSPAWRKLKCAASQELVVGGWTLPERSRIGLGALMVGYWDGDELRYAGKVGTGFSDATLRSLRAALDLRATGECPFTPAPKVRGARWVRPELVAEVSFAEWTADGRLRHPSFRGLREDKDASEVVRETRPT